MTGELVYDVFMGSLKERMRVRRYLHSLDIRNIETLPENGLRVTFGSADLMFQVVNECTGIEDIRHVSGGTKVTLTEAINVAYDEKLQDAMNKVFSTRIH